jgi:hypothetical protein
MSYRKIHKVELVGTALDVESIARIRADLEHDLIEQQKELGRVQLLDITPLLDTKFDAETEQFTYRIVMHFVYVGKVKAQRYFGELGGSLVGG